MLQTSRCRFRQNRNEDSKQGDSGHLSTLGSAGSIAISRRAVCPLNYDTPPYPLLSFTTYTALVASEALEKALRLQDVNRSVEDPILFKVLGFREV